MARHLFAPLLAILAVGLAALPSARAAVIQRGAISITSGPAVSGVTTQSGFSVPGGTNRLLVVSVSNTAATSVTSVTFGGTPMTKAVEQTNNVVVDALYYLALGTSVSPVAGDIVATSGTSTGQQAIGAISFRYVDQTASASSPQTLVNAAGLASSLDVASKAGDLVYDFIHTMKAAQINSAAFNAGQTGFFNNYSSADLKNANSSSTKPGASSVNVGWTTDATATIQLAINLNQASASSAFIDTSKEDFEDGVRSNIDTAYVPGDLTLIGPVVDQQSTSLGTSGNGITVTSYGGQTFTAAVSGQLTRAEINLFASSVTGTTPNLTLSVRATSGGLPTGPDLATATIAGFNSNSSNFYAGTFSSPLTVTAGTQYALVIRPVTNPSVGTYAISRSGTSSAGADVYAGGKRVSGATSGTVWSAPLTGGVSTDMGFRTYIYPPAGYAMSGDLISSVKDSNPTAQNTHWTSMDWTASTPASTTVTFQVAASNSASGPFNFVGPDRTSASFFTTTGASLSQFDGSRYLKYRAYLASTDAAVTPALSDITVSYDVLPVPTVLSPTQTILSATSARLGADVTSDGGQVISEIGVVISKTSDNSDPKIGGDGVTKIIGTGTTGVFTVDVSGLLPSTVYSYAAYAINGTGTTYTTPATTFTTFSTDAALSGLVLSAGKLAPGFSGGTMAYTADVDFSTSTITVTPTTAQTNATVTVDNVPVATGNASGPIALNVGANTITMVVTAQDGITTKTYAIGVTRTSGPGVSGTMSVSGSFAAGGTVSYAVTLSNSGGTDQPDNLENEFFDALPASLTLISASASSGTAVATSPTNTVTWDGSIPAFGSVSLLINAIVGPTTAGMVSNQGTVIYDADYDGSNEASAVTDDPNLPGLAEPTVFIANSTPVANGQSVETDEDTGKTITLTGSDLDNDPLTYSLVTQPQHGVLTGVVPNLTYTPAENYHGPDAFTFQVNDGNVNSAVAIVSIGVVSVNDLPVADAKSVSTDEDTAKAITLSGSDLDSDPLTYIIVTQPQHGALSGVAPNVTYTPADNYFGADSFTFKVNDSSADSTIATISLNMVSVNDAPVANAQDLNSNEDTAKTISLTGGDVENDALTYAIVATPQHGALTGTAPNLTYTPTADYYGADSFTFKVNDGMADSSDATISIAIAAVNDAPTLDVITDLSILENAATQTVGLTGIGTGAANELEAVNITASSSNPTLIPNPTMTYSSGATGSLGFQPAANANGTATITVTVNDGQSVNSTTTRTFKVTVTSMNQPPTFVAGANQTVVEDAGAQIIPAWASQMSPGPEDEAGQTLNFLVTTDAPALFAAAPAIAPNGTLTFTPAGDANGSALVRVKLHDNGGSADNGSDTSAEATFTINLTAVNDAPSFTAGANPSALENAAAQSIPGWATNLKAGPADESAQSLTFLVSTDKPALFTAAPGIAPDGTLTFTPAADASGSATVTVSLQDSGGTANNGADTSATQTFTINLTAVNNVPSFTPGADVSVAQNAEAQTISAWATAISPGSANESDQTVNFIVTVDDASLFTTPPTISPDGTLTFAPAPKGSGTATVTVKLHDSGGTANGGVDTSAPITFKIIVTTFKEEAGIYNGLVQAAPLTTPDNDRVGVIKLNITRKGTFTGQLKLSTASFTLKGSVNEAGAITFGKLKTPTLALVRKGKLPLALALKLDVGTGTDKLTGTLTGEGDAFAVVEADRFLYVSKKNPDAPFLNVPSSLVGRYTVVFAARAPAALQRSAVSYPQGDGVGLLTVTKAGTARLRGTLADGTAISCANALSKDNRWPFYVALAKGQGSVSAPVHLCETQDICDLDAHDVLWFKPADSTTARYTAGWPEGILVDVLGSKFVIPPAVSKTSIFTGLDIPDSGGNATAIFADGDLPPEGLTSSINVSPRNTVKVIDRDEAQLTMTMLFPWERDNGPNHRSRIVANGMFTGTFMHPVSHTRSAFKGVIFQKQKMAFGFFTGPTECGSVVLEPQAP